MKSISGFVKLFIAFTILLKIYWMNDVYMTLRQDPLELWTGVAIAMLLMDSIWRDR